MSRNIVTYKDWGGESGRLSRNSSAKAPRNSFTGSNMYVTTDGLLCVRPGLQDITPAGLSNGVVQGFGNTPVPSNDLFFVQGTAVRTFASDGTNLKTSGTALASTPTVPVDWKMDTTSIVVASAADKLYRITPQGGATVPTVAGLTGSPGARCVEIYGERVVAGFINGSGEFRLRYSDAANPNSWPAGNFVDIGDNWGIYGLHSQRQHLAIVKQNGIHVLTGTLGSTQALRKAYSGDGVLHPAQARMGAHDRLWFQEWAQAYPSHFNGAAVTQLSALEYGSTNPGVGTVIPPSHGIAPLTIKGGGAAFISSSSAAALYLNGVWTYHIFGGSTPVSGYVASNGSTIYICNGGSAGTTPKFYAWNLSADTPGTGAYAGDASTTPIWGWFELPEWWTEDGSEVTVRSVVVDFINFDTDSATNNHFDLTVTALRRYQGDAGQASTTVSYDAVTANSTNRRVFGFGEQGAGSGFQIDLDQVHGIGIVSIQVIVDTQPARV